MTGELPPGRVTISVGQPQNLATSEDETIRFRDLKRFVGKPTVTREKFHQYKKKGHKQQNRLKGAGGWLIGTGIKGGTRNRKAVQPRKLLSFDLDNLTPEFMERLQAGEILPEVGLIAHTTRSHTPENPRARIFMMASEQIHPDDYRRASRIIGLLLDPEREHIDFVSFRPAQMMYLPTCSSDMEKHFVYYEQGGKTVDWRAEIDAWEEMTGRDSLDVTHLPTWPGEEKLRDVADEAEDPLEKKGPVGDYCRAWSITDLVMGREDDDGNHVPGPLAEMYQIDDWENGAAARMTYLHGHSVNGAVVYGDKFIFSHHGTDPCSDMLVNAYDAVRIHLYGDKDKGADEETPMKDRPSVKKMAEYIQTDPFYKAAQVESRYGDLDDYLDDEDEYQDDEEDEDDLVGDLDELEDDDGGPSSEDLLGYDYQASQTAERAVLERRRRFAKKPSKGWIRKELNLNHDGSIKAVGLNAMAIIKNDPRLFRKIALNELSNQIVLLDDIDFRTAAIPPIICRDKVYGDRWQDIWTEKIDILIQQDSGKKNGGYDLSFSVKALQQGLVVAADHNAFHPGKDYYDSIQHIEPDEEALETFLVRHMGAEDTAYVREVTRKIAIASVARVEEPGCKFDFAPILEGPQGTGKSTAIRSLYGDAFFGELDGDVSNAQRNAESMMGKLVMELPELSSLHKSETNDMKAFITRRDDSVRMAYGRNVSYIPRQCVFWGTTNDSDYLRDPTGNRRYWPIPLTLKEGELIDQFAIIQERDVFWATAVHLYRKMREQYPNGDLPLALEGEALETAKELQKDRRKAEAGDKWAEEIIDYMEQPLPIEALITEMFGADYRSDEPTWGLEPGTMVKRVAFRVQTAKSVVLRGNTGVEQNLQEVNNWEAAERALVEAGWVKAPKANKVSIRKMSKTWIYRGDASMEDRQRGYILTDLPPQDPSDPDGMLDDEDDDLI